MTRYLLSVYQPEGPPPAGLAAVHREMKAAGAWVFAAGLYPPDTATVVRDRDGDALLTDGPYAEAPHHLGGFTVITAADLDAALAWAGKLARASARPVEVRPVRDADGG